MKMTCKEAARLMSRSMDGELPLSQRLVLRLHLAICDACRHIDRQMRFLRRAVARLSDERS